MAAFLLGPQEQLRFGLAMYLSVLRSIFFAEAGLGACRLRLSSGCDSVLRDWLFSLLVVCAPCYWGLFEQG